MSTADPVTTTPAPPAAGRLSSSDRLLLGLLVGAAFVVILNETIMGVALPRLMTDLSITAATAQWLTTGFLLTMAIVIPATGWIMTRFPLRAIFVSAMGLFTLGTALAAIAPGFELLLAGRIVQASGTAVMMPLVMTTALAIVPPQRRGSIMGTISIVIAVAPAIGPTVSGLILAQLSWRWLFIVMLPIAVVALVMGALKARNVTTPRDAHLDVVSLLLSAVGFGGLIFGLSSIGEAASGHVLLPPWIPIVAGVLALVLFTRRQFRPAAEPFLDLRVFAERSFTVSTIVLVVSFMALFGGLIVLPIYLQQVLGLDVLQTGLLLLPGGALMGVLSPIVGGLFDRVGPLVVPGVMAVSASLWILTTFGPTTPVWAAVAVPLLLNAGLAFMITPLMTTALGSLRPELYPHGTAAVSTIQQLAGAAGTALFVTVLSTTSAARLAGGADQLTATAAGVQGAFLCGAVVSLVAVAASFLVRRPPVSAAPAAAPLH